MSFAGHQECFKCSGCWNTNWAGRRASAFTKAKPRFGIEEGSSQQVQHNSPQQPEWRSQTLWCGEEIQRLGAPVGQVEFVQAQLTKKGAEHEALLEMIPQVPNVRVVLRRCEGEFPIEDSTAGVDSGIRQASRRATGPLSEKGSPHQHNASGSASCSVNAVDSLGIGNSERTRDAAHWGSWADCLEMIKIRHPDVVRRIVQEMATRSSRCFQAVEEAASRLRLMGVDTPNWEVLSAGLRPEEGRRVKHRERDPTQPRHGWQKVASAKVHKQHRCTEVGGRPFSECVQLALDATLVVHPSWGWDTFEEVRQDGRGCFAIGKGGARRPGTQN